MRWPVTIEWTDDEADRTYEVSGTVITPVGHKEEMGYKGFRLRWRFRLKKVTYRGIALSVPMFMAALGETKIRDIREQAFHVTERDSESFRDVYEPDEEMA